jgi:hypothetical protein
VSGATIVEFDDASHAGGYATRFTKLIEQADDATAY